MEVAGHAAQSTDNLFAASAVGEQNGGRVGSGGGSHQLLFEGGRHLVEGRIDIGALPGRDQNRTLADRLCGHSDFRFLGRARGADYFLGRARGADYFPNLI